MSESNNYVDARTPEERANEPKSILTVSDPITSTTPDTDKAKIALILTPLIKQIFHGENHTNEQIHKELDNAIEKLTTLLTSRDTYWKEQLQNARIDWLRSEIEKLEGVKTNYVQGMENGLLHHREPCQCQTCVDERNDTLTSIITRYKEELLELEKDV